MKDRSKLVRLFVKQDLTENLNIALTGDQARYLFKVMRLKIGQLLTVLDGKTGEYEARIIEKNKRAGIIHLVRKISEIKNPSDLWLLFAPLRKNRTEWIVEKATELGVRRIIPVITSRTIDKTIRPRRLESIMIEALEQCGGNFLPELIKPITLGSCLDFWPKDRQLVFCDETLSGKRTDTKLKRRKNNSKAGILIGPEGGFSITERKLITQIKSSLSISLGERILRADTAAVAAISFWKNFGEVN